MTANWKEIEFEDKRLRALVFERNRNIKTLQATIATLKSEKERAEAACAEMKGCVEKLIVSCRKAPSHIVPFVSVGVVEYSELCDAARKPNPGSRLLSRLAAGEKLAESALAIKKDLESDRGELTCREWWGETPRVLLEAVKALAKWEAAK